MIYVLATIEIADGKRDEFVKHFRENIPNVLNEEGCIEYGAAVDADGVGAIQTPFGEDTFVVVEKWESLAALGYICTDPYTGARGVEIDGDRCCVQVRLTGACKGCPMSQMTLKNGIERMVLKELPEIKAVERVLTSGKIFRYNRGGECQSFEQEYGEFVGAKHVQLTASGSSRSDSTPSPTTESTMIFLRTSP